MRMYSTSTFLHPAKTPYRRRDLRTRVGGITPCACAFKIDAAARFQITRKVVRVKQLNGLVFLLEGLGGHYHCLPFARSLDSAL